MASTGFSRRLLQWFDRHGRKDLPWQCDPTPYRVWVSEVMLQQTQVATVIPYYLRFMERFPDVRRLAAAPLDEVLHHWTGLGYYARARHLHRAAQEVVRRHGGRLPADLEVLRSLPGIGRSTAAAILALSQGQPHAILDGNVKRVLCRYHAVDGWPGTPAVERQLWSLAQAATPRRRVAHYTQAIMDLGATLCSRSRPGCVRCPLNDGCRASREGHPTRYPAPRPGRRMPVRATRFFMLCNERGEVLLMRRPPAGVWGGLWCFPECPVDAVPAQWCRDRLHCGIAAIEQWPSFRHTFSHFHLDITPLYARLRGAQPPLVMEGQGWVWYNPQRPDTRGLATPVKHLVAQLSEYQLSGIRVTP